MAKIVKMPFQGREIDATELKFDTVKEEWNEYKCEDGSVVRLKTVASKIFRTGERNPATGELIFMVRSSNILDVVAAEGEEGVH